MGAFELRMRVRNRPGTLDRSTGTPALTRKVVRPLGAPPCACATPCRSARIRGGHPM